MTVKAKCRREGQTVFSVISAALVQVQQCLAQDQLRWATAELGWGEGMAVTPDRGQREPELCVACCGSNASRGSWLPDWRRCSPNFLSEFGFPGCETNK